RRLALALEETARDASRRVGVLTVVHREGEEIDPLPRAAGVAGRDEHHRIAHAHDDGAVGLPGPLARLDAQRAAAERNLTFVHNYPSQSSESECRERMLKSAGCRVRSAECGRSVRSAGCRECGESAACTITVRRVSSTACSVSATP